MRFTWFLAFGLLTSSTSFLSAAPPGLLKSEFIYETASFPSCHASTIVEPKGGGLVAAWFGGTHEKHPDVGIWVSRMEGGAWTVPVEVTNGIQYRKADGTVLRHPTWNPVLFQPNNGPLMLFYKAGPDPQTWWGMLTTSTDGGKTWEQPRRLPEGIFGPIKNKPVQLANGDILCPLAMRPMRSRASGPSTSNAHVTWGELGNVRICFMTASLSKRSNQVSSSWVVISSWRLDEPGKEKYLRSHPTTLAQPGEPSR